MERKWRSKEGFVVTFIDFSKAFDSLAWETLWKIMECLGCPAKMVAVVRSLYSQSTISIRLSNDGDLAPAFYAEERHNARIRIVAVHLHHASGFCHESSRYGVRRVGNGR